MTTACKKKSIYETPQIDFRQSFCEDALMASKEIDNNQGEWDPQGMDFLSFLEHLFIL